MNFNEPLKKDSNYLTGKEKILEDEFGAEFISSDEFDAESVADEIIVDDKFLEDLTKEK